MRDVSGVILFGVRYAFRPKLIKNQKDKTNFKSKRKLDI